MATPPAGLESFLQAVLSDPSILDKPNVKFFKDFLNQGGWKAPEKKRGVTIDDIDDDDDEPPPLEPADLGRGSPKAPEPTEEPEEPEEVDDGVWPADTIDPAFAIGQAKENPSDEDMERAQDAKAKAVDAQNSGNFEEAIKLFTEAIKVNKSPLILASRGQCFLKMKKPNAAIADCTAALAINPDSAKALKTRGKAYRHLGEYEKAQKDLAAGQAIDGDEDTAAVIKFVVGRVQHLNERRRKRAEREKERARKQRNAPKQEEEEEDSGMPGMEEMGGMGGGFPGMGGMGGMGGAGGPPPDLMNALFSDPEIMQMLQDPEVMSKLGVLMSNPAAAQNDPKLAPLMAKMMKKFGGGAGGGGF